MLRRLIGLVALGVLAVVVVLVVAGCGGDGADARGGVGADYEPPWNDIDPPPQRVGVGRTRPPGGVFVDVSASERRTCGVREGGRIECWGDALTAGGDPPEGSFVKVSLAPEHACAIGFDQALRCWSQSLGVDAEQVLLEVPGGGFTDVWAPGLCGVRVGGELACWGFDGRGEVELPQGRFIEVFGGVGRFWACALGVDGQVACWGDPDNYGRTQLPEGRFVDLEIGLGDDGACAVRAEGPVVCWVHRFPGRDGSLVAGEREGQFTQVLRDRTNVCALTVGGDIECWGDAVGEHAVSREGPFTQISGNNAVTCGLRDSGQPVCWGRTGPDGQTGRWDSPPGRFTQISATDAFACGVRTDTTIGCWPSPEYAVPTYEGTLMETTFRWTSELPKQAGFAAVRAVLTDGCALRLDRTVWCSNDVVNDQMPEAGRFERITRVYKDFCGVRVDGTAYCASGVPGRSGEVAPERRFVKFFPSAKCGLGVHGGIECWGFRDLAVPEGVGPLVSAAVVLFRTCGVRAEGSLACWEQDPSPTGELLGLEEVFDGVVPEGPLARVVAARSDEFYRVSAWCVLSAHGEVWCSASSVRPELVDENDTGAIDDVPAGRFVDLAISAWHGCAIRVDGTVACWGRDSHLGQL